MQLPEEFIERTKPLLGSEWNDFVDALQETSPTSIRVNSNKIDNDFSFERVKWSNAGYYLPHRPAFTFDPLLHMGGYYVQEASSMFLEYALTQLVTGKVKCLDLCAAPGGKSTIISNHITEDSFLVANEVIRSRANILAENLMKWGNVNNVVTSNKAEDFSGLTHFFDFILVDAPCSGEGMFRKDAQTIEEWSVGNIKLCAERQKSIIKAIWNSLKLGGYLFYSTCTYNREENEDIVSWMCDTFEAQVVNLPVEDGWAIKESDQAMYHFYPHRTKGEGFFFAALQKKGEAEYLPKQRKTKADKRKQPNNLFEYVDYLKQSGDYTFLNEDGTVYALPSIHIDDFRLLSDSLNVIHKGVLLGELKGRSFIPHQSLALSNSLHENAFPSYDVDWTTAVAYLRKEALILNDAPIGLLLLTYENKPLGFVKNLGNRANNLYPNEWRIRSSVLPEKEVNVLGV